MKLAIVSAPLPARPDVSSAFRLGPAARLIRRLCGGLLALVLPAVAIGADGSNWPSQLNTAEGRIVIHQPEAESLEGNTLKGRAAVAVTPKGQNEPVFGTIWFEAVLTPDTATGQDEISGTRVSRARLGDATPEQQQKFSDLLTREISGFRAVIPHRQLLASLDLTRAETKATDLLKNDPPRIVFEKVPAILVVCDGEPQLRPIGTTRLQKLINTPFFVAYDPDTRTYWLHGGAKWYSTSDPKGTWWPADRPTPPVAEARQQDLAAAGVNQDARPEPAKDKRLAKIVLTTEPAELIVTDGDPQYGMLEEGKLLYLKNTESDVFMDLATQDEYVLLSGRWFRSQGLKGPWEFVRPDSLPASFSRIAPKSPKGHVRAFIAGTPEAQEAILDAQVPRTAAVKRSEAKVDVLYDGEPQFQPISLTSIAYAVNCPLPVLRIANRYYCCDRAIWFMAGGPRGPWGVCDVVPPEVQTIPPECPLYNVRYVRVYGATPDRVYMGYTPGYTGSYLGHGAICFGTGWRYQPWIGAQCYPYRPTWGYHVNYNPWTGWSYGSSWSAGWTAFSFGFGCQETGWWGPGGYRWRPNDNYLGQPDLHLNRPANFHLDGFEAGGGARGWRGYNNLYSYPENRTRVSGWGAW